MSEPALISSFGGGHLVGTNIVRVVYVDEAGRGRIDEEPILVVAAAITHPDTQWHALRQHYTDLANDVLGLADYPAERRDQYVLHAMDVWHGSGDFPRSQFSLRERMKIINRLSAVPSRYDVPICLGAIDKREVRKLSFIKSDKQCSEYAHVHAYGLVLQKIDTWMRKNCPGEVAEVKAEDTDEVKRTIDFLHEGSKKTDFSYDDFYDRGLFQTAAIVDEVSFVLKHKSPVLQIADHCAFLAKRHAVGCPHVATHWANVWPQVQQENNHEGSAFVFRAPLSIVELRE